jgi:hypothetical protein
VLYRDVSRIIYRAWLGALQESRHVRRAQRELLELRTQLDLSLDSAPEPILLRNIWARAGFLHCGVAPYLTPSTIDGSRLTRRLQLPSIAGHRDDQGLREILALVSCADAYRVVLGETKERQARVSSHEQKQQSTLQLPAPTPTAPAKADEESKKKSAAEKLAPPTLATLTGAAALFSGGPNQGVSNLALGIAVGAAVWLITWISTNYGTQRQSRQETRRDRTTDIKWDVERIERDFPKLIKRVKDAGFAPIFILDELDKMSNAKKKLEDFLLLSKHLVTDDAAFLFLTNRNYYETLITDERRTIDQLLGGDRPPSRSNKANSGNLTSATFYTYRIFVRYNPDDFRRFLFASIAIQHDENGSESQADDNRLGLWAWGTILIYRSRMLPFNFDRRLKLMIDPDGQFDQTPDSPFGPAGLRQELAMQMGIELIAGEDLVQERIKELPYFAQYVYDTLYFVADLHSVGRSEANTDEAFTVTPDLLRRYLWSRAQGEQEEPMPRSFVPPDDANFLFGLLRRYLQLLENPRLIQQGIIRYARSGRLAEEESRLWPRLAYAISEWPIVEVISSE